MFVLNAQRLGPHRLSRYYRRSGSSHWLKTGAIKPGEAALAKRHRQGLHRATPRQVLRSSCQRSRSCCDFRRCQRGLRYSQSTRASRVSISAARTRKFATGRSCPGFARVSPPKRGLEAIGDVVGADLHCIADHVDASRDCLFNHVRPRRRSSACARRVGHVMRSGATGTSVTLLTRQLDHALVVGMRVDGPLQCYDRCVGGYVIGPEPRLSQNAHCKGVRLIATKSGGVRR